MSAFVFRAFKRRPNLFISCLLVGAFVQYHCYKRLRKYFALKSIESEAKNTKKHVAIVKFFHWVSDDCRKHLQKRRPCFNKGCPARNLRFILDVLESTKKSLDISMHLLTLQEAAAAIINCHNRGVRVRVLCDVEYAKLTGSQIKNLILNGVTVKTPIINSHMHMKVAVIDNCKMITGSANWTTQSLCGNWENLVLLSQPEIVNRMVQDFEQMWNHPSVQVMAVQKQ